MKLLIPWSALSELRVYDIDGVPHVDADAIRRLVGMGESNSSDSPELPAEDAGPPWRFRMPDIHFSGMADLQRERAEVSRSAGPCIGSDCRHVHPTTICPVCGCDDYVDSTEPEVVSPPEPEGEIQIMPMPMPNHDIRNIISDRFVG